jgi:hypothetical protein
LLQIYEAMSNAKSQSDKPKTSAPEASSGNKATANQTAAARSDMFKLPQVPVPMRRGI